MKRVVSLKSARQRGLKWYFTGKPCQNGHFSERSTGKKQFCRTCHNNWARDWYAMHAGAAYKPLGILDQCARCGGSYVRSGGGQKYCSVCGPVVQNEQTKAYYAANRSHARDLERKRRGLQMAALKQLTHFEETGQWMT